MPRLAWFSPLPPSRSGIAAYSTEIVPRLARTYAIDLFADSNGPACPIDLGAAVFPSTDFIRRHRLQPYDLVVYQLGNAPCHDYMWGYLGHFPGLVVLHDAQLHQARAKNLLTTGRAADYREEFRFCHPDANPGIAEIVIAALGGSLYFLWPLNRVPIECARLVAVHTDGLAVQLRDAFGRQEFRVINMGVADPLAAHGIVGSGFSRISQEVRARHGIPSDRVVFAAYGMLTPEKRLREIFKAMRAVLPAVAGIHLLLVGQPVDHYDVEADAREHGLDGRVTVTGYVPDAELSGYLAAADVCLCLRWPTSRETSASWLRCLAAGKPTVINDLVHLADVPALDPRTWAPTMATPEVRSPASEVRSPESGVRSGAEAAASDLGPRTSDPGLPICVTIDIVDEQHSLGLAVRRLARDRALREDLGRRAREYWAARHTLDRMEADYHQAIDAALRRPAPDRAHLPAHLVADGTQLTRRLLGEFGLPADALD